MAPMCREEGRKENGPGAIFSPSGPRLGSHSDLSEMAVLKARPGRWQRPLWAQSTSCTPSVHGLGLSLGRRVLHCQRQTVLLQNILQKPPDTLLSGSEAQREETPPTERLWNINGTLRRNRRMSLKTREGNFTKTPGATHKWPLDAVKGPLQPGVMAHTCLRLLSTYWLFSANGYHQHVHIILCRGIV